MFKAPKLQLSRITSVLALLIAVSSAAQAQSDPQWDRQARLIGIVPDPAQPGRYDLHAQWSVEVLPATMTRNLSTRVQFFRNGNRIGPFMLTDLQILPVGGSSCLAGPPCGGSCGSGILNGSNASLFCHVDCVNGDCDCECGAWIKADLPSEELEVGDEITVILYAAAGALPETDTSNDSFTTVFEGGPIYWDRGIQSVDLIPNQGGHDVQVLGTVEFNGLPASNLDLGLQLDLSVNGVVVASQLVAQQAEPASGGSCWYLGCGSYCGKIGNIQRYCDPVIFSDCGCGAGWITLFPGIPNLGPDDEITVILYPAPGALPELFPQNNEFMVGTVAGAESSDAVRSTNALSVGFPNPMRRDGSGQVSTIRYQVGKAGRVALEVFDSAGRRVRTLVSGFADAGPATAQWDGRSDVGAPVSAGAYYYRLVSADGTEARSIIVLE